MHSSSNALQKNNGGLAISKKASISWVMLIYFASGACSLIDEVVWVRLLKLTLGNTVYASSIVVSIFMGGLALGALIMSRYSDRIKKHLQLYALLEMLVTISALALPWGLGLADRVYIWFFQTFNPSHIQLLIVQILFSAVILLIPSMLMGSTLPLLGRFVTSLEKEAGHMVGKLYALNTLGAAVGCFLAGFVLIRAFGVMGTLYTAAGLNLLVAFGGGFLSRFHTIREEVQPEPAAMQELDAVKAKEGNGKFYLLMTGLFVSGLISIGYEILWMRSIVHLLGGFTYVFSGVLTVYLLGNVIGAGIGSKLAKKLKNPATGFAVTLSILGVCGILYLPVLILWTTVLLDPFSQLLKTMASVMPSSKYLIGPILQSTFLFIFPAVIMGIGFPIALQAWANHVHKVGRSTGTAYGANTIGAVLGGIVTGFIMVPMLGLQTSIFILGLLGLWVAGFMWLLFAKKTSFLKRWAFVGVATIMTIVTFALPPEMFYVIIRKNPLNPHTGPMWVDEGVNTTLSVHRNMKGGGLSLCASGQPLAGENHDSRGDQKILGHFGVLLNPKAQTVLSVGFGSGESTACLATHELEQVDCVEIAPEVVEASLKFFRHLNLGDRLNDEVNMIFMDAKNYIHLTDVDYDSIINDSIHPSFFAENASLYGKEYFEAAMTTKTDCSCHGCPPTTYHFLF